MHVKWSTIKILYSQILMTFLRFAIDFLKIAANLFTVFFLCANLLFVGKQNTYMVNFQLLSEQSSKPPHCQIGGVDYWPGRTATAALPHICLTCSCRFLSHLIKLSSTRIAFDDIFQTLNIQDLSSCHPGAFFARSVP